ncbi:MAG: hypothetical protein H0V61_01335 [Chitinophagales bacterium]|nr:hypothetical protein [Chitinophagales bacterium]
MKYSIAFFYLTFLISKFTYSQSYPTAIAVKVWSAHFPDWENGTLSVEGIMKRALSKRLEISGSVSNIKDDQLLDPEINPDNYILKYTSRTLTYFDLAIHSILVDTKKVPVRYSIFFGPSYEMGGEFLFYGIINVGFPETDGNSLHRNHFGLNAGFDLSVTVFKRMEITGGTKIRTFIAGRPMYCYGLGLGYRFNTPFDKRTIKS